MNEDDPHQLEAMSSMLEGNGDISKLLSAKEPAHGEEDAEKDLETFGDIGPLTNEWEDKHQQLALDIERGRQSLMTSPTPSEVREKFDASQYAFFGGGGDDLEGLGDEDGAFQDSNTYSEEVSEHDDEIGLGGSLENMGAEALASAFEKLTTGPDQAREGNQGGVQGSFLTNKLSDQQTWSRTAAADASLIAEQHIGNTEFSSWQSVPEQQQRQLCAQHRIPEFKQRTQQWWEEDGQGAPVPTATGHKQGNFQQPPLQVPASTNAFQGRSMGLPMHGMPPQQQYPFLPGPPPPPGPGPSHWQVPHNGAGSPDPASLAHMSGVEMMMLQQHQRNRPAPQQVQPLQYRQSHQSAHHQQQRPIPLQPDRHGLHGPQPHVFPVEPAAAPRHHYQAHGQSHGAQQQRRHAAPPRAKYMTQEEIDNIMRIQWSATHMSDPYIDDYYHQAVQQKLTAANGSPHGRRHFAPTHLRDLPSHAKAPAEQPGFVSLHGLGRVPFANIRRPRPLLEVETQGPTAEGHSGLLKLPLRPLEQEPMLAARIAIEDGMCILLDVDDIDRLLSVSQQPDVAVQLRRQRQQLLEALGHTLQLVPDAPGMDGGPMLDGRGGPGGARMPGTKDDLVFLRLCSLPKGRKLLTRYLQLVPPGGELSRGVAMAVMRHLRFLFGGAQADQFGSQSSNSLARAVAAAGSTMDLPALSACLAAVVIANDHPPLRPLNAPAGDGATVILRALLDRATQILAERGGSTVPVQHQAMWQASFDAFFALLSKYCSNKFESIVNSMALSSGGDMSAITVAAAAAMGKELPVEILWSSLPHTNEHQRKLLLEFTQRSMNMGGFPPSVGNEGIQSAAPVCC